MVIFKNHFSYTSKKLPVSFSQKITAKGNFFYTTFIAFMQLKHRYFILHKPYNMVSQFVSSHPVRLLTDINFNFPEGTHAIGRLDNESEGLLLLTTNKKVTRLLFQGLVPHVRTYLVQVNKTVEAPALQKIQQGISIQIAGGGYYTTTPCQATIITNPQLYFTSSNAIKVYEPYTWLKISLTEGKFHQVRKMVLAAGHKCKRLIRIAIEDITLNNIAAGTVIEIDEEQFFKKLKITNWN
jgi:23S rRNA pseudouridine2457 synthase